MKFDLKQTQASSVIQNARSQIKPTVQPKYKNTNSAFQGNSGEYMKNLMAKCRTVVGTSSNTYKSACPANKRPDFTGSKTVDWVSRHNMHPLICKWSSDDTTTASFAIYYTLAAVQNGLSEMFDNWFAGESMDSMWPSHEQFDIRGDEIDTYLDMLSGLRDKFYIKSLVVLTSDENDPDMLYHVDALLWICFEDINEEINAMYEEASHSDCVEWYYCGRFISNPYDERDKIDSDLSKTEFDDYSISEIADCMILPTEEWLEEYVYSHIDNGDIATVSYAMYEEIVKDSAANKTKWICLLKLLTLNYQINAYRMAYHDGDPTRIPFAWDDYFLIEGSSLISIVKLTQNTESQATIRIRKMIHDTYSSNATGDKFKDVF